MSLVRSACLLSRTGVQQQQQQHALVARNGQKPAQRGMRVVRHFKSSDDQRIRELATMPEQPVTMEHPPPPADLADIIPNPGKTADTPMPTGWTSDMHCSWQLPGPLQTT